MAVTAARTPETAADKGSPVTTYYVLAVATALLVLVGLAIVLSSSSIDSLRDDGDPYAQFKAQVLALAIGVIALAIVVRFNPLTWKRIAPWTLALSVVGLFLVATSPLGHESGGNKNWLDLGLLSAQPSEAAKLGLALYLGVALSQVRHRLTTLKQALMPAGFVALLVVALVLAGRDIGTVTVMLVLVAAAFWTAGLPVRYFVVGTPIVVGAIVLLVMKIDNLRLRVDTWLSDNCDISGACLQTTHGTWALASGGVWGLGPGLSREKWLLLPKPSNDFVYAILGEEFGLIGTIFVLVALGMIVVAVNRLVRRHRDPFVQITSATIGAWIVGQALLNIAVVIGFAPVTGVPLPFISSGGSSLVMSLVGMGVLLSFARREPGAQAAFATRGSVVRRSLAVMSRGRGRRG